MDSKNKSGEYVCRTVEEITAENLVVQQLDEYIEVNGDSKDNLVMKVLRLNLISHEQNKDDRVEILKHIDKSKANPSLLYLFRYKTVRTVTTIFTVILVLFVVFRMTEIFLGLEELLKAALLP